MPATLKAAEENLAKVFSQEYFFEIPEYQRPYAWTTDEVGDLMDDLCYAMGDVDDILSIPPYFLGSIVIIKDPESLDPADIIDGQQRITTLTILFCVLRELANGSGHSIHDYVFEQGKEFENIEGQYRLRVRDRDRSFFQDYIQEPGVIPSSIEKHWSDLTDSRKRFIENTKYIWEQCRELKEEERKRLTTFLVQRCYLVVVSTTDRSSAYRIFSVMNARGMDLLPTDSLKSDIIGAMVPSLRKDYTQLWEDIEDGLGRDSFNDLFSHIRMIYVKSKSRGALYDEFRTGVLSSLGNKGFIDDVLKPYADIYQTVSDANHVGRVNSVAINQYLKSLNRLDNFDWLPPALAFLLAHQDDDDDMLLRFIRDLERLAYGLFIRRANINERINRYAEVLQEIENDEDIFRESSALQIQPDEKSDILDKLNGAIYLSMRVRMPLLLRLDSLMAEEGVTVDHSIVTVEHVLPQNPSSGSQWLLWFPDDEDREKWTHRLANLVLLSRRKNSQAQNYSFDHKKNEYFVRKGVSTFALTVSVLGQEQWTPEVLEQRQRDLIDRLATEWRLR